MIHQHLHGCMSHEVKGPMFTTFTTRPSTFTTSRSPEPTKSRPLTIALAPSGERGERGEHCQRPPADQAGIRGVGPSDGAGQ